LFEDSDSSMIRAANTSCPEDGRSKLLHHFWTFFQS